MESSIELTLVQDRAIEVMRQQQHEYLTPEHMLYALCDSPKFSQVLRSCSATDAREVQHNIDENYFSMLERTEHDEAEIELSYQTQRLFQMAASNVVTSQCDTMTVPHIVNALLHLDDTCYAYYLLDSYLYDKADFLSEITDAYGSGRETDDYGSFHPDYTEDTDSPFDDERGSEDGAPWRSLVTCITRQLREHPDSHGPLIGREAELDRTIQVLCRLDKNNPLHVGEPGVGKTALVYGLARRINEGRVPERLKGSEIYLLDLGSLLADTQYRGDFEKRIKLVMEGVASESGRTRADGETQGAGIIYIDEIHNIVGAGRTSEGSFDAANMLKPYLESGSIRFIGSTTYGEYNRHFSKSLGIVRRFQQIDIAEPSIEDTIQILEGLRERYEKYHGVVYEAGVFEHTVRMADRYINDRFLPDKAIDIIDEAGAKLEATPLAPRAGGADTTTYEKASAPAVTVPPARGVRGIITRQLVDEVLACICKVESFAEREDDTAALEQLESRIRQRIYGQDEAVKQVVEAVQMSRAGLIEDGKPVASFLFVGPTGVGKTEVARVLAQELNLELIRFDMSEYAEKHTVAKLIGSPAGYVGYDDGGLLTDAVRKTPHCVLLFDEIEKAHPDVFNIFLQMMDYARLTDNKGRKADFRHAVIIMTSNAGAQFASQASVGFSGSVSRGEAMLATVQKTFKPEFIARLSATVVFHDMDAHMAEMIFDKKLREFSQKLAAKHVNMTLTPAARQQLISEGFTQKTGAREMDRVIAQHLKPLFTRAILFGDLKNGGEATVEYKDAQFTLTTHNQ